MMKKDIDPNDGSGTFGSLAGTISFIVLHLLLINDTNATGLNIYPNPNTRVFRANLTSNMGDPSFQDHGY